jgi:hypothetical protein
MLCTLGELRGCQAAAFHDEEEAWRWLREQLTGPNEDVKVPQRVRSAV